MQSFRQYRQLGERVKRQLDQDSQKLAALQESGNTGLSPTPHTLAARHDAGYDPEMGEESPPSTERYEEEESEPIKARDCTPTDEPSEEKEEYEQHGEEPAPLGMSLSRASTRSQRTIGTRLGLTLTGINVRSRTTKEGGDRDQQVFVVDYQGPDDPCNPHNWSRWTRAGATVLVAFIGAVVGIASSIDSEILRNASQEFHVSEIVESMATGLFLIGFGCGALFAGPISETVGRNPVYIVTLFVYMIWIMASALAPNIATQLVFRFLAGFFGSTPLTWAGGSVADMWDPLERVIAFPVFANAAFMGPIFGMYWTVHSVATVVDDT